MIDNLRVVSVCSGRFHIFDQARELARHGILQNLVADYPRWKTEQYGVPSSKIIPLLTIGTIGYALRRYSGYVPEEIRTYLFKYYHYIFSRQAAAVLPKEFNYLIGLSSFSLESIRVCKDRGIKCAVDHGSLHIAEEKKIVGEEAKRWRISLPKDFASQWIIDRESEEFKLADNIFVLSNSAKNSFIREGVAENKIFVNPCGVDLNEFYPGQKTDSCFRILQVSGISLRKGVLDLAKAFFLAGINNSELEFVGGGLESSGLRTMIEKLASTRVRFTRIMPQSKLKERYHQASVFVLASLADGFGMVVTQAMACGLPVIVTDNVGASDLVQDGINGFVVPIQSPEVIAEKLQFLNENPLIARRMGDNARYSVMEGFTWQDYGDRLAAFLQS